MLPGMIGTIDPRHKKFELDWIDAALYRLRIRESTVVERKDVHRLALSWIGPSLQDSGVRSHRRLRDFPAAVRSAMNSPRLRNGSKQT
jgi:Ni,Fe-hydrogenase III large subunit